jgi:DnaJ-class molecular chaperone
MGDDALTKRERKRCNACCGAGSKRVRDPKTGAVTLVDCKSCKGLGYVAR